MIPAFYAIQNHLLWFSTAYKMHYQGIEGKNPK